MVALAGFWPAAGVAQEPSTHFWATAGLGGGPGIASVLADSVQREDHVVSLRWADTWEGGIVDVGVLYGRVIRSGTFHLSASGGLAAVYGWRVSNTIGVPLEAQVFLRKGMFGLGLYTLANVNLEEPTWAVTLAVQVGRLPL